MMILIGVLAVFFAVVNQQAGILFGLSVVVGPAIAYMIARVHRVNQGGELPSKTERVLGEIAVTILAITTASAVLAASGIVAILSFQWIVHML